MIVVADTSVLLNLCCIGRAEFLPRLFAEVAVPPAVATEFSRLVGRDPRFAGLMLPAWLRVKASLNIPPRLLDQSGLDAGETAAIALALEISADAILLDERHGHAVASELGLVVIGLLGVLLRAKRAGHLAAIAPELERLREKAGFWISDTVRARVLELAGESS